MGPPLPIITVVLPPPSSLSFPGHLTGREHTALPALLPRHQSFWKDLCQLFVNSFPSPLTLAVFSSLDRVLFFCSPCLRGAVSALLVRAPAWGGDPAARPAPHSPGIHTAAHEADCRYLECGVASQNQCPRNRRPDSSFLRLLMALSS